MALAGCSPAWERPLDWSWLGSCQPGHGPGLAHVSVQWDRVMSQAVGGLLTSLKLGMSSAWELESQDAESTAKCQQGRNLPPRPGLDTEVVYCLLRVSF